MKLFIPLLTATLLPVTLGAQADDSFARMQTSQKEVMAYLQRSAKTITARSMDEISSRRNWQPVAEKRREELRRMLGLLPWPARTPLNVQITGKLDRGDFVIEKLAFESMPHVYVTANLYVPKQRTGRVPTIVYVCGHGYSPYGAKTYYQRHGISLAKNGYVAIILDPIQIAETYGIHHGVEMQEMYDWYARGYTPAGVEVWNAMRAIDYLETRPEVDAARIGMTGRSGGAAMTWFTAAVDTRVKVAAPVMGLSTYDANLQNDTQRLHCDCMFTINAYLQDMAHQAALIAPRPLLMAHGRFDALFPVAGYTAVEESMKKLYLSYGVADSFTNIVVDTDHKDSDFLREQAIRWFDRFLMKAPDRKLDMAYENAPEASLAVFPNGAPTDAMDYRVQETFLPTAQFAPAKTLAAWEQRRSALLESLRKEVFPAFPRDNPKPAVRRLGRLEPIGYEELEIESDPGVHIRALVSKPREVTAAPALIYVASEGEDPRAAAAVLGSVRREDAVRMIVYPRGVGALAWPKSTWKDIQRNAMHVGQTVDSMRLWDVIAATGVLRAESGVDRARVTLMGRGNSAALALYAAVLQPEVEQVTLIDPPATHVNGPYFLNVLRNTDLPEMAAMMAPRRVNFYGKMLPQYDPARSIYALYAKPDHVWTTTSFAGPVLHRYDHGFSSGW